MDAVDVVKDIAELMQRRELRICRSSVVYADLWPNPNRVECAAGQKATNGKKHRGLPINSHMHTVGCTRHLDY